MNIQILLTSSKNCMSSLLFFKNLNECSISLPILNRWQLTLAFLPEFFPTYLFLHKWSFPGGWTMQETLVQSLGWEGALEKEMATRSSILAWKIPWTEESGGSQKSQIWLGNCKQTTKNSKTSDPSWQKYWYVAKLCRLSLTFFRSTMKPSWWLALYSPVKVGAEGLKALVKQVDFTGRLGGSDHPMAETGQEKHLGPVSLSSPHTHLPHTWHKLTMHLLCYQTENVAINFFKEYCIADLFLIIVSKS